MHADPHPIHAGTGRYLPALTVAVVVTVSLVDALVQLETGIGLLVCIPVLAASFSDDGRAVWMTAVAALLGFVLVAFGGLVASPTGWSTMRGITLILLVGTTAVAVVLQGRRLAALELRDSAISASELNQLLMSLLAHDLRAPLSLADQGFQYVEESVHGGYPIDRALVTDVRARLQRSLRAIEMVLSLSRGDQDAAPNSGSMLQSVTLADEIADEVSSFTYEARIRGKALDLDLGGLGDRRGRLNVAVLRQAIAIPLDNAVRYALPGQIRVSASLHDRELEVRVDDSGPGITARRADGTPSGSGLGLRLCGALLARAGGSLRILRDGEDGTSMALTLPVEPVSR